MAKGNPRIRCTGRLCPRILAGKECRVRTCDNQKRCKAAVEAELQEARAAGPQAADGPEPAPGAELKEAPRAAELQEGDGAEPVPDAELKESPRAAELQEGGGSEPAPESELKEAPRAAELQEGEGAEPAVHAELQEVEEPEPKKMRLFAKGGSDGEGAGDGAGGGDGKSEAHDSPGKAPRAGIPPRPPCAGTHHPPCAPRKPTPYIATYQTLLQKLPLSTHWADLLPKLNMAAQARWQNASDDWSLRQCIESHECTVKPLVALARGSWLSIRRHALALGQLHYLLVPSAAVEVSPGYTLCSELVAIASISVALVRSGSMGPFSISMRDGGHWHGDENVLRHMWKVLILKSHARHGAKRLGASSDQAKIIEAMCLRIRAHETTLCNLILSPPSGGRVPPCST